MDEYGIKEPDVINAILNHTTGRPEMSTLEKIIFIADYIEPNRKQAPNLAEIRKLAFIDLDKALLRVLEDTLAYLEEDGGELDPMTKKTYDYYCRHVDK
jgi:predicted HD superfamily hydrolase involved in NAD metabolism